MIRLVGPGGAGKTTVGNALARRLGIPFLDLDLEFTIRFSDISDYLASHGYRLYAKQNIEVYLDTLRSAHESVVFALSSGFMTYEDPHPAYQRICREIIASPRTFVLLPSFDYEICVAETVSRQLGRPFSRSAEREEEVIRGRFHNYWNLPVKKCATNVPIDCVIEHLLAGLRCG